MSNENPKRSKSSHRWEKGAHDDPGSSAEFVLSKNSTKKARVETPRPPKHVEEGDLRTPRGEKGREGSRLRQSAGSQGWVRDEKEKEGQETWRELRWRKKSREVRLAHSLLRWALVEQVQRRTGSGGEQDHEERKETDKEEKWRNGQVRDLVLAGWLPAAEKLAVELK